MRAPGPRLVSALLVATFVVAGLRVGTAWADAGIPPDLVRLKNGGMVRGTIVELVPGKDVTFIDVAGQTRKLPMSDVAYAGPAAAEPAASTTSLAPSPASAPAPTAAPGPSVPQVVQPLIGSTAPPQGVRLIATEPNLTFHVLAGTSQGTGMGMAGNHPVVVGFAAQHYERLCTAPCTAPLAPGSYTLALAPPDGDVVAAPALTLRGNEEIRGTYTSHSGARIGLFIAGLLATGLGPLIAFSGKQSVCSQRDLGFRDLQGQELFTTDCQDNYPHQNLGLVVFTMGLVGMLVPLFIRDTATIVPTGN